MNALPEQVRKAVQILKKGGIIAFPTDTVYGLGTDAFNRKAVERIYAVKKRPRHLSFPLLLADIAQVSTVAEQIPELAWFLARYLLPKAASLPTYLTTQSTIAVRVPNHPIPLALIQSLGSPIIGTSANISGKPSILIADEVEQQLGDKVDLIIDGGKCPGGSESTIVDVTGEVPTILRQGIISTHGIDKAYKEYCEVKGHAYCSRL